MLQKRFQTEESIGKLRHATLLLGQGETITEVVNALGINKGTCYRWRQEFGGMITAQARRLKMLAREEYGQASRRSGELFPKQPLDCLRPPFCTRSFIPNLQFPLCMRISPPPLHIMPGKNPKSLRPDPRTPRHLSPAAAANPPPRLDFPATTQQPST